MGKNTERRGRGAKISNDKYPLFHFYWLSGITLKEIGYRFGASKDVISGLGARLGLPPRQDGRDFRLRRFNLMIDPPSGWKYGFPREFLGDIPDLKQFLLRHGYPESQMILNEKDEPQHIRMILHNSSEFRFASQIISIIEKYRRGSITRERAIEFLSGYVSTKKRAVELVDDYPKQKHR